MVLRMKFILILSVNYLPVCWSSAVMELKNGRDRKTICNWVGATGWVVDKGVW